MKSDELVRQATERSPRKVVEQPIPSVHEEIRVRPDCTPGRPVQSREGQELVAEFRRRFGDPASKPPARGAALQSAPEHELVVSCPAGRRGNGKILVVRCRCMAEYRAASRRYFNYDPLGEVGSLDAAVALYQQHLAQTKEMQT